MKVCQKCFTEVEDHTRFCPNCGTQIVDESGSAEHSLVGRTLAGKFLIKEAIGSGAMGSIYRAEQINLGREACIKILHPHLMGDPTLSKRFHREARAASRLKHPNCINVIDFGIAETDNLHFIAMDFLDGRDLSRVIRDEFPLPPLRILHLAEQMCAALDEAHAAGIIHRDLKPENVFVEDRRHARDFVTVLDFGIAKIKDRDGTTQETFATMAGMVCGTPEYMSPEQGRGDVLDARSDLYALGVILFHMNAGRLPFTGETPIGIVTKHLTEPPPDIRKLVPTIHPAMADLVHGLLSKNKEHRPASAMAVKRELERLRGHLEKKTGAHSTTAPMTRPTPEELVRHVPRRPSPDPEATEPAEAPADLPATDPGLEDTLTARPPRRLLPWALGILLLGGLAAGGWFLWPHVLGPAADDSGEVSASAAAPDAAAAPPARDLRPAALPDVLEAASSDVAPADAPLDTTPADATPAVDAAEVAPPPDVAPPELPPPPDPRQEAAARARERLVVLSGVLGGDKDRLVTRQSALVTAEATWAAKDTARALEDVSALETRAQRIGEDLAADRVEDATAALETLAGDVDRLHAASEALLAQPVPTREEVEIRKTAEVRVQALNQELAEALRGLGEARAPLAARRDAWAAAERPDRAAAVEAELRALDELVARHEALRSGLRADQVDRSAADAAALAGERSALADRCMPLLKEKVRSAAEEEAERQRRADQEQKRLEEEARRKASEEERIRREEEARRKAAEKAAAEEEFRKLVQDADAARGHGSYAAAIGLYKQALKVQDSTDVREKLGKAYNATSQNDKAAEQFRVCIQRLQERLDRSTDESQRKALQDKINLIQRQIR
ncbi:MAG: protein kinase [Deltaproteobacteria bacterium]|nr:protein kinase [Deltaproteobacteria bacterium]